MVVQLNDIVESLTDVVKKAKTLKNAARLSEFTK